MANKSISGLTASAANLASTDVAPFVQTTGVGPVKMTGLQLAGGLLGAASFNGATVTTSQPVLNLSQTWNAGAVTFTGLKFNATDTASASGSLLLDLQVGGAQQFVVGKSGAIVASGVTVTNSGATGTATLQMASNTNYGFHMAGTQVLTWGSASQLNGSIDLTLRRAAAATLQLGAADTSASATVTITIATPGVVTWSSHGLSTGTPVIFSTTGALPTGITAGTTYYVIAVDANTFQIATSYANATAVSPTAVTTSGSQSGTHTGTRGAVDQVFRVQSASGTSNFPGADFAIQGSRGTGTGAGGSIIFQVAPAGSSGTAQNAYATALTLGVDRSATVTGAVYAQGTSGGNVVQMGAFNCISVASAGWFGFGPNISATTGNDSDTRLFRDAANTLALRNGATAQTYRIYATTDSPVTNFQRLTLSAGVTANMAIVAADNGGTGIAMGLQFGAALTTGGGVTNIMNINTSGHLVWNTDNTYDIGAFNGSRPRYGYFATGVAIYGSSAGVAMLQGGDGILRLLNYNNNDFNRIQFGGTTSSFPALKRSSAALQVRLADDSAFAQLTASSLLAAGSTGVVGYSTGAGGAVTQATSRTTGVTLNKGCGQITLVSAAGTTSWQSFTVSNTTVAATDTIIVNQDSGTDLYQIFVTNVAANSFQITFATTGGTTTEQPVFSFAVIKAVAA